MRRSRETKIAPIRRLRGLDEFVVPAFVGRMARTERARHRAWWATVGSVVLLGVAVGLSV